MQVTAWGSWLIRRALELVTFTGSWLVVTTWRSRAVDMFDVRVVLVAVLIYALVCLYLPLSAAVWYALGRWARRVQHVGDSVSFLVHGYVVMSLFHNGLWVIDRSADLNNPLELSWLSVAILHVVMLIVAGTRIRGASAA